MDFLSLQSRYFVELRKRISNGYIRIFSGFVTFVPGSCQRGEGECPQTWQSFQGYCHLATLAWHPDTPKRTSLANGQGYLLIRHHLVFAEAAERCKESQYVQPTEGTVWSSVQTAATVLDPVIVLAKFQILYAIR